jgi:hypothetical protein
LSFSKRIPPKSIHGGPFLPSTRLAPLKEICFNASGGGILKSVRKFLKAGKLNIDLWNDGMTGVIILIFHWHRASKEEGEDPCRDGL